MTSNVGPPGARYSETRRQLVHIVMGGFALLLRYLSWPQAALMALGALAFNAFLLERVSPAIIRPSDSSGHRAGVLFYPLSVLLLILVFRDRLDIVAAAWAVMAFGDGAATIAGTHLGGPRLPWNHDKSWAGLCAFIVAGFGGAIAFSMWMEPIVLSWFALLAATLVAALVETIPIKLDDNLSVPFAAGATLALAAITRADALEVARLIALAGWPMAVGVNIVFALAAWALGSLTLTGAIVGTLLGIVIFLGAGNGWFLLLMSFAFAVGASRIGRGRKVSLGLAEERSGRRGAGNAIANCLVGAIGAWLMALSAYRVSGEIILMTGLVAGASDTVASEIGKAHGGLTRAFPTLAIAPPGTPGAISFAGTIAGLAAAVWMSVIADYLLGTYLMSYVVIGATAGAFAESALATRFESRGILNNDVLNFINTAVAAAVAILSWRFMTGA